jgi:CSLREA domain-containing protein
MRRCLLLACLLAMTLLLPWEPSVQPAHAAGFTVNSTVDQFDANPGDGLCASRPSGACTLRAAIMEANALPGPDTINVPAGTHVLTANRPVAITSDVTLVGASARDTIISTTSDRVFTIAANGSLDMTGITIRGAADGAPSASGGIDNQGRLVLKSVQLLRNGVGRGGGGLNTTGTAILENVLLEGNRAFDTLAGGACPTILGVGGGISNSGDLTLTNVTLSNNFAGVRGGAISSSGVATLTNVSMVNNTAPVESGCPPRPVHRNSIAGSVRARNVIIMAPGGNNCEGAIESLGNNIENGNSCGLTGPNDLFNTDPRLAPLQNNGGLTDTVALLPDSPAIDRGADAGCPATDQRGVPRPLDGNLDGTANCDIGAVEFVNPSGPLPASLCSPRPPVRVATARSSSGSLAVSIDSTGLENSLRTLRIASTANADVEVAGQPARNGAFSVDLTPGTTHTDGVVRRQVAGQAATVQVVVVDRCGEWPSFVGGGPGAF